MLKVPQLCYWWNRHYRLLMGLAITLMVALAVLKLGVEFRRLVWEFDPPDAVDLKGRYEEVHRWFASLPVYIKQGHLTYPPASYVLLWPFLGWLPFTVVRWVWAATAVAALVWTALLSVRESGATTSLERVFIALLPFSMSATGATIGRGQRMVHLLPALMASLLLLCRGPGAWWKDLLGALLFLFALVKPTASAPFFWILLFVPGRFRPAGLVVGGYLALTLIAAAYQEQPLSALLHDWLASSLGEDPVWVGYADLHMLLVALGIPAWRLPASLVALGALGLWTYRYRYVDLWLQLGVAALVARLWSYHLVYDDGLILLAMVALFRFAKIGWYCGSVNVAAVLFAVSVVSMIAPGRLLLLEAPWGPLFRAEHALIWIATLAFFVYQAHLQGRSRYPASPDRIARAAGV